MRLALVSLIALTAAAGVAVAQPQPPAPPPAASDTPPASSASTPAPAAAPEAAPPAPAGAPATAPAPAASDRPPASSASTPAPATAETPAPEAQAPPAPPSPPTDPTAISVLAVLQNVCIPGANGGNFDQLAKAAGYRKSGDNWSLRQRDFTLTVENPGSNPTQCHVDLSHPVDPQAPGRPIVVALHGWAAFGNGWTLYRNDKNVQGGIEYTTRSWTHSGDGKTESLVFTTRRHSDGTPMQRSADTSELIYGVIKDSR
jgi:hypothetical protein